MPKIKPDVRFIVQVDDQNDYLIATFHAAVKVPSGALEYPQYRDEPGREFVDLVVRSQLDRTRTSGEFYGWRPTFKPWELDLERAESMVKVLRSVDRRLRELSDRFGWPQDLAAFMGHMADAVGATSTRPFARRATGDQDITGTGYRYMDVDDLRRHLAEQANEWLVKHGCVRQDAA
jgi:hypothetical protein